MNDEKLRELKLGYILAGIIISIIGLIGFLFAIYLVDFGVAIEMESGQFFLIISSLLVVGAGVGLIVGSFDSINEVRRLQE